MVRTERTSIHIQRETKRKLDDLKPFPSVTYDDLVNELIDAYQEEPDV